MKEKCAEILRQLTEKRFILFVKRGNVAIRLALKLAKKLGCNKVLLQDQGGWITYKQFCKKEKLETVELRTDCGLVDANTLKNYSECSLLINSMPAYAALQDMKGVERVCREKKIFLINDVSGSIGTAEAKLGDLVLGSFAIDKPVNIAGHGGFIAANNAEHYAFLEKNNLPFKIDFIGLSKALLCLNKRLSDYKKIRNKIIKELEAIDFANKIIHKDKNSINLIVKYDSEAEKEKLINLCNKERLEFTLCPRRIRVNEQAVSIEIKRQQ